MMLEVRIRVDRTVSDLNGVADGSRAGDKGLSR